MHTKQFRKNLMTIAECVRMTASSSCVHHSSGCWDASGRISALEPEGDVKATDGCIEQGEIDALTQQNLAGEGEADARATPFGGKEGNEDLPAQ